MKYIVWVGGSIIYEGSKKSVAERREKQFLDWGYDDVIMEDIKEEEWALIKMLYYIKHKTN